MNHLEWEALQIIVISWEISTLKVIESTVRVSFIQETVEVQAENSVVETTKSKKVIAVILVKRAAVVMIAILTVAIAMTMQGVIRVTKADEIKVLSHAVSHVIQQV